MIGVGLSNKPQLSFRVQHVGFGKHENLTLWQLYKQKPSYIQWLRSLPDPSARITNMLRHAELMDMVDDVSPIASTADETPHQPQHHGMLSDSEKMETMKDRKLGFGKHSELTVGELYSQHYSYVQFLRREQVSGPAAKCVLRYAEYMDRVDSDNVHDPGAQTVSSGQHSGKTFSKVYEEDYDYIVWLRHGGSEYGNFAALLRFATEMDKARVAAQHGWKCENLQQSSADGGV